MNRLEKGCLIAIAVIFVLVAGGGLFVWMHREDIVTGVKEKLDLKEYGEKEYIDKNYGKLLRSIDGAADNANSIMTFGAAVEGLARSHAQIYASI